jgi:hypothetical protein
MPRADSARLHSCQVHLRDVESPGPLGARSAQTRGTSQAQLRGRSLAVCSDERRILPLSSFRPGIRRLRCAESARCVSEGRRPGCEARPRSFCSAAHDVRWHPSTSRRRPLGVQATDDSEAERVGQSSALVCTIRSCSGSLLLAHRPRPRVRRRLPTKGPATALVVASRATPVHRSRPDGRDSVGAGGQRRRIVEVAVPGRSRGTASDTERLLSLSRSAVPRAGRSSPSFLSCLRGKWTHAQEAASHAVRRNLTPLPANREG